MADILITGGSDGIGLAVAKLAIPSGLRQVREQPLVGLLREGVIQVDVVERRRLERARRDAVDDVEVEQRQTRAHCQGSVIRLLSPTGWQLPAPWQPGAR